MPRPHPDPPQRHASTSGDVEVSTYLEIAREKGGEQVGAREEPPVPEREAVLVIDFG